MKVISNKNTIFQFKVGDVIRSIDFKEDDGIISEYKFKIVKMDNNEVILKRSKKHGSFRTLKLNSNNINNWILNKDWIYNKYKAGKRYRKSSGGGYWG